MSVFIHPTTKSLTTYSKNMFYNIFSKQLHTVPKVCKKTRRPNCENMLTQNNLPIMSILHSPPI